MSSNPKPLDRWPTRRTTPVSFLPPRSVHIDCTGVSQQQPRPNTQRNGAKLTVPTTYTSTGDCIIPEPKSSHLARKPKRKPAAKPKPKPNAKSSSIKRKPAAKPKPKLNAKRARKHAPTATSSANDVIGVIMDRASPDTEQGTAVPSLSRSLEAELEAVMESPNLVDVDGPAPSTEEWLGKLFSSYSLSSPTTEPQAFMPEPTMYNTNNTDGEDLFHFSVLILLLLLLLLLLILILILMIMNLLLLYHNTRTEEEEETDNIRILILLIGVAVAVGNSRASTNACDHERSGFRSTVNNTSTTV